MDRGADGRVAGDVPPADQGPGEGTVRSAEAFVTSATIHLVLDRLEPNEADAEFQYRVAA